MISSLVICLIFRVFSFYLGSFGLFVFFLILFILFYVCILPASVYVHHMCL